MKIRLVLLFLGMLSLLLAACHLEKITGLDSGCDGVPPTADFSLSSSTIDLNQTLRITNLSEPDAASYAWDYGDGNTSDNFNATLDRTYAAAGTYEISLVVTNAAGCSTTVRKTVTVSGITRFVRQLTFNANPSAVPLCATQRPADGKFHCLFLQAGSIGSAVVNTLGTTENTVAIPTDISANFATPHNGGFLISGSRGAAAKVVSVNAAQQKSGVDREFQFSPASSSIGTYAIVNANNEVVVTGYRLSGSPFLPGIARIGLSNNTTQIAKCVNNSEVSEYGSFSVAPYDNGYYLAATQVNPYGGAQAYALRVLNDGTYSNKFSIAPLYIAFKILRLANGDYAVMGYNQSNKVYVVGINSSGTKLWERPLNNFTEVVEMVATADGQIAICGSTATAATLAKFPPGSGSALTFERSYPSVASVISLQESSDGGFLMAGAKNNAFFLIKTDPQGIAE
jgi:PKD repeat protein